MHHVMRGHLDLMSCRGNGISIITKENEGDLRQYAEAIQG